MTSDNSTSVSPDSGNLHVMKNETRRLLLLFAGLFCFGCLLYFGGFESFNKITHPDYPWLLAAVSGTGLMIFIFAVRWGGLVNTLVGHRVTGNSTYFFYSLSSLAMGVIMPHAAGTVIGRVAALKKFEGVSLKKSAASILLDKMFDGFFMLMFSWPLLLLLIGKATVNQVVVVSIVEFTVVSIVVIVHYTLWIRLLKFIVAMGVKFLALFPIIKKHGQWKNIEASHQLDEWDVLQKKTVLRAYFLTAAGQIMMAVRAWLASMVVGLGISPLEMFVGIGLVQASMLISLTPAALGFADAAWFIALAGAGIPKEIIVVFLVVFRIIENMAILVCWLPLYIFQIWTSGKDYKKESGLGND